MRVRLKWIMALCLVWTMGQPLSAVEVVNQEEVSLNVGGRLQWFGTIQKVTDKFRDDTRMYLFLKQSRFSMNGRIADHDFYMQLAFAGESELNGKFLNLLDYYVDVPFLNETDIRIGQMKVPFGREALSDSGYSFFADRSIHDLGTRMGRDIGAAFTKQDGTFKVMTGVFTGGGRDVPERYIPEKLGAPASVLRFGWDTKVDSDMLRLQPNKVEGKNGIAFFVSGLFERDTLIGHSTVYNVKYADKSLLLNDRWNPFVKKNPAVKSQHWQVGADLAVKKTVGSLDLSFGAEYNYAAFQNTYGKLRVAGGQAQIGLSGKKAGLAVRGAVLIPDRHFSYKGTQLTGRQAIYEITPAINIKLKNNYSKIILDLPILVNIPVVTEPGFGSYVINNQFDQVSNLTKAGSSIERKDVVEARLLYQFQF